MDGMTQQPLLTKVFMAKKMLNFRAKPIDFVGRVDSVYQFLARTSDYRVSHKSHIAVANVMKPFIEPQSVNRVFAEITEQKHAEKTEIENRMAT